MAKAKDFTSILCVHPASYPMGTGGSFPGSKARVGREADHSPHPVQRSRISMSYIPLPLGACMP
jgi:hypothetical protein